MASIVRSEFGGFHLNEGITTIVSRTIRIGRGNCEMQKLSDRSAQLANVLEQTADRPFEEFAGWLQSMCPDGGTINEAIHSLVKELQAIITEYQLREQMILYLLNAECAKSPKQTGGAAS